MAATKATVGYIPLTGPDHAPFVVLEHRGGFRGSGKVTLSWEVTRSPTGYYEGLITDRRNPFA
jgi:ABC-type nitrate/sulfonate/bicarbonate transport system substrate-binding protein